MNNKIFESTAPTLLLNRNMELTLKQLQVLNALLPKNFKIEVVESKNTRKVIFNQRRAEIEGLAVLNLPEKRLAREKDPEIFIGQNDSFKKCFRILQSVKKHPLSCLFLARNSCNESQNNNEEVFDLNLIESKLGSGEYLCAYHLAKDIRSMFNSSFFEYSKEPELFVKTFELSKLFEKLFKGNENLIFSENIVQDLNKKIEKLTQGIKEIQSKVPSISQKDKKMTAIEKKQLCQSLKKLDPKHFHGVLKIVKKSLNTQGDEIEFDVEKLPNKVCRELERYIKQYLQIKTKKKIPVENPKNESVSMPNPKLEDAKSESSESSSSSSDSEEELPDNNLYSDIWDVKTDFNNDIFIDFE